MRLVGEKLTEGGNQKRDSLGGQAEAPEARSSCVDICMGVLCICASVVHVCTFACAYRSAVHMCTYVCSFTYVYSYLCTCLCTYGGVEPHSHLLCGLGLGASSDSSPVMRVVTGHRKEKVCFTIMPAGGQKASMSKHEELGQLTGPRGA